jgi:TM2 domain-containing membrane protein YozV
MILLNKYIFIIFLSANFSFAQEYLPDQFEYAKKLFKQENYFDAITEFKRLKFFDEKKIYEFQSDEYIALSYKEGGKFSEAIQYFILAEINAVSTEDVYRIKTGIIRSNILRRTTENAQKLLDELSNDQRWSDKTDEINYWRGWAFIFADKWDNAAKIFSQISPDHELKILCEETHEKKYSVAFAKLVSVILPGSGQFYTGNYLSGLISLGWCTLWGYITVNAFIEERIFDGLAVANLLWFRFYQGNLQNAENFAVEKNVQISNESLYYLQHYYKGVKP